jgi:RNA polymerase sigma-70 factor (sigma-E family)
MRLGRGRHDVAFTEFASVATPRLFRSAVLLCGDYHLAEDLVQTTLAKLYVAWPSVERADSADAYARGALTKTFLSHKRVRRNAEQPRLDLGERADGALAAGDVSTRIELFDALARLDPLDRAIVVLRYWNDRSVEETATSVGLSAGAVRARASRALARLRVSLADEPSDPRGASS